MDRPAGKTRLKLVPLIEMGEFRALQLSQETKSMTLRQFLLKAPSVFVEQIDSSWLDRSMEEFILNPVNVGVHITPEVVNAWRASVSDSTDGEARPDLSNRHPLSDDEEAEPVVSSTDDEVGETPSQYPLKAIREQDAVQLSYQNEIELAASFLEANLSVVIQCDKLTMSYIWEAIARQAHCEAVYLQTITDSQSGGMFGGSSRQQQIMALRDAIKNLKKGFVLVIPHLDLLAGGADANLNAEARELVELLYDYSDRLLLAFFDRSLSVPEVVLSRFDVRLSISGIPQAIKTKDGSIHPVGKVLVTQDEQARFKGFEEEQLYKNVAGMNPIQLRHAFQYAMLSTEDRPEVDVDDLYDAIRGFKVQTSANFEVPNVRFDQIGGYVDVKAELRQALALLSGQFENLEVELQRELIPRGFIFYGPPGTGKTLFAKAIAHELSATIQVVSGPEVMDMYVGESERKLRELFAEARRNAPSVLVFDEFDSLAMKREQGSGGGARAGNAVVAQMLTEMDGFRTDVPMLVIGTTNRLDIIDPALLRPSRFRPIPIGNPDPEARLAIATIHAKKYRLYDVLPDVENLLEIIAQNTDGFSGDEIQSVFRQACIEYYCVTPDGTDSRPMNAYELGKLVGKIRSEKENRSKQDKPRAIRNVSGSSDRQYGRDTSNFVSGTSQDTDEEA